MGKVIKDTPLVDLSLRKFELPSDKNIDELLRKFCISLGLLQPGDSRDIIVDIFKLLLNAKKEQKFYSSAEIEALLKQTKTKGIASSNIRRQLLRLEKIGLAEKINNNYRIREFLGVHTILSDYIKQFIIEPTFKRIQDYAKEIDKKLELP